jgi:hypothetical protein
MKYFLGIKFLLFLFFSVALQNFSAAVVEDRSSFVSTSQIHSIANLKEPGLTDDQLKTFSRGAAHRGKAENLLKIDQEWRVTMDVITANLSPTQKEDISSLVKKFVNTAPSSKIQGERIALLKTLVLGPVEKGTSSSSQRERLQSKAVLMELTSLEDRLSLIASLQRRSEEKASKALQQAHDFLTQNTNAEDRALIARSFVSFEDPIQGDDFSRDLEKFKTSKRLNGRMIFRAAQAWRQDRRELLESWRTLMSFEDLRRAKDRVVVTFLSLPSSTRKAFLGLLPKEFSANSRKVRSIHKILEEEGTTLEDKTKTIRKLSELQKKSPTEYEDTLYTMDEEADPAPSSDEASSGDEGFSDLRSGSRRKFLRRHPVLEERNENLLNSEYEDL